MITGLFSLYKTPIVLATFLLAVATNGYSLSPEFESDRLMLLAQEQVDDEQFSEAEATLRQIQNLKVTPPSKYYYLQGLVLSQGSKTQEAIDSLVVYVESSGKDAEHYNNALRLISQQKNKLPHNLDHSKPDTQADIEWSGNDQANSDYVDQIRYLYQSKTDIQALLQHINNMLQTYRLSDEQKSRYSLGSNRPGKLITKQQGTNSSANQITVYGVNPYVQYNCSSSNYGCQLFHPVSNQPWLRIKNDEQAAKELSKAIAELIKLLQANA